jgi:hypothetical protein
MCCHGSTRSPDIGLDNQKTMKKLIGDSVAADERSDEDDLNP